MKKISFWQRCTSRKNCIYLIAKPTGKQIRYEQHQCRQRRQISKFHFKTAMDLGSILNMKSLTQLTGISSHEPGSDQD